MTLKEAKDILAEAGVESALYDAREIFSAFGGFSPSELVSQGISTDSKEAYDAVLRRAAREPLQYIIGEVDFYRERYKVTPDCLIPRSDTEILVDYAVKNIPRGMKFLDLCTGSGCIAISVLNNTKNTTAVAVDISEGALAVAKKNAFSVGVSERIDFLLKDATEDAVNGEFFAILSNPPYVADSVYEMLSPEIAFEPKAAFVGGTDGGDFYRAITPLYKDRILKEGFIAYEIGYDQATLIEGIAKENGMSAEIIKDLSGNDRLAVLRPQKA